MTDLNGRYFNLYFVNRGTWIAIIADAMRTYVVCGTGVASASVET